MPGRINAVTADALKYYIDHPVEFAVDILNVVPDPVQAEIMNSVAHNARTTVRSGHGIGKSAVQSWLILWFLATRPFPKIPCTAPTKHQLYDILWAEVAKWLNGSKLKGVIEWTYERVYLKGHQENWFAVPRTATKPDALQGFHADHILYIVDEASGVPDVIFAPVLGALSTADAKLLMCGNPTNLSGFFFDSHNKNRGLYESFHVSSADSPRVDDEFIRLIVEMYGKDSDVYRVRVDGEFPKHAADSFIALDWIERCSTKSPSDEVKSVIDIGVDVARYGDDKSVICTVFDRKRQQTPEIYAHNDTMQIAGHVANMVKRYWATHPGIRIRVKIDCDGLGVGVYDRLKELALPCTLRECHFGGRGGAINEGDPVEMANSTGLMWGTLRQMIKAGEIELAYNDELISQLSTRRYRINSDGKIELERKEDMKKRGLKSPDIGDALALAVYEPQSMIIRDVMM